LKKFGKKMMMGMEGIGMGIKMGINMKHMEDMKMKNKIVKMMMKKKKFENMGIEKEKN
jgi:hypothetical protein